MGEPADTSEICVVLFGTLPEVHVDGRAVRFSYDKVRALLLYLLLQPGPVLRSAVAELLWPEQHSGAGRTNLRHALHTLRQVLGPSFEHCLRVSRQHIAIETDARWWLETAALDEVLGQSPTAARLQQSLQYYRGALADGLRLSRCSDFQRWLQQQRNHWRQRMLSYAEQLFEGQETVGIALLRQLLERFGDYTPFHVQLITRLVESGRIAAARECQMAHLQQLALAGQRPPAELLSLARHWSQAYRWPSVADGPDGMAPVSLPSEEEIDHRQISVMAMRLSLLSNETDRGWERDALLLSQALMQWLEQQCRYLGGFWIRGSTGGIGLACFGTHGPAHQLAELVALHEHCRLELPAEIARHWPAERLPKPSFELSAGVHSGRVLYLPEHQLIDPHGRVTQPALALLYAARGGELVISYTASQHMPPTVDLQPRLKNRTLALDGEITLRALRLSDAAASSEPALELYGREQERRQLGEALARVEIGVRQSVLIRGESGMGKSALMVDFRRVERLEHVDVYWLAATRISYQESWHLILSLLSWRLGRKLDEPAIDQWMSDHLSARWSDLQRKQLRTLLTPAAPGHGARQHGSEALELMTRLALELITGDEASGRPLIMMIDDFQWLDEASRQVLARVHSRLPIHHRLMLLASQNSHETISARFGWDLQFSLGRLSMQQSRALLGFMARRFRLPLDSRLSRLLVERSGGVPLYLQELCRRMARDREAGRPLQVNQLPNGLYGLLSGRIDQLDDYREVAHIAAVIGMQFRLDVLLECLTHHNETSLRAGIERMLRLEIIVACATRSEFDYQFSHQLLQEAAYLNCPAELRQQTHRHLVAHIEQYYPIWLSRHPGYFAQHLQHSGNHERAARYFELAAREALDQSAYQMALRMVDQGLQCLSECPGAERRISLLVVRSRIGFALEGHLSSIALDSLSEASQCLESDRVVQAGTDPVQQFMVYWGNWLIHSGRLRLEESRTMVERLRQLSRRFDNPRYRYLTDYAEAYGDYWRGSLNQAGRRFEALDPLHRLIVPDELPWSEHPRACACAYQAMTCCMLGEYQQAELWIESAIRLAESLGHRRTLALILVRSAVLYRLLGLVEHACMRATEVLKLAETEDMGLWQQHAHCIIEWCHIRNGEQTSIVPLERAMREITVMVGREVSDHPVIWYMEGCLMLGKGEHMAAYLERHLQAARERRALYLTELLILAARWHRSRGSDSHGRADALLEEALKSARQHDMLHGELMALEWGGRWSSGSRQRWILALRHRLASLGQRDLPILRHWHSLLAEWEHTSGTIP